MIFSCFKNVFKKMITKFFQNNKKISIQFKLSNFIIFKIER